MLLIIYCDRTRAAATEDGAEGKEKKRGVQTPDEWPWEQAKKLFERPDVTLVDELEVRPFSSLQVNLLTKLCLA